MTMMTDTPITTVTDRRYRRGAICSSSRSAWL